MSIGTLTIMREKTKYNKLIGRIGNEYYFLDYLFFDNDGFKGATGTIMYPMTENEYDDRVKNYFDPENIKELWEQAVKSGKTTLGLNDWIELVKNTDGEENIIDRSYTESYGKILKKKLGEKKAFEVECIGGGRCFDENMQWDEMYNEKLWKKIQEYEK